VCLVAAPADGTTYSRDVLRSLQEQGLEVMAVTDPTGVGEADCRVVVWTGGPDGGVELAAAIGDAQVLVAGPGLRDPRFLQEGGPFAEGAISHCSCADVSTSLDLAAQRFIQDFQSEYGSAPGTYAVEAWDAAQAIVLAIRESGGARAGVVDALAAATVLEGLGGPYAFDGGELAHPESAVRRYAVEGGRWVAVPADGAT
jgi:branched-chain amino acid transport system substrate-binding protein